MTRRELHWNWNGQNLPVTIEIGDDRGTVVAAHQTLAFDVLERTDKSIRISIEGKNHEAYFVQEGRVFTLWFNGSTYRLESREPQGAAQASKLSDVGEVQAPMAGKVTRVDVAAGDTVSEQQVVVILESMKMETSLSATRAGRVSEVLVKPGDVVEMGARLVVIE
jgi:biotin carboxyl carrier protein